LEQRTKIVKEYLTALQYIMDHGKNRDDRTGTGTRGVFGYQMRFSLRETFPAVTTKKLAWRGVVSELLWFLEGSTDERRLAEILYEKPREELIGKTTIWTANADKQGKDLGYFNTDMVKELGPIYGHQWRTWDAKIGYVDQIAHVLEGLYHDPYGRRHVVSTWNADQIQVMALPPCHTMFQFHVQDGELSCQLYQRSVDAPLGLPFNIASYSLLTHMFAQILGLKVGEFIHTSGDLHIYRNQIEGITEQLKRDPMPGPTLEMPEFTNLDELVKTKPSQYKLINYQHHPEIKMPFAV
jgi:thymidylate synthase